jgi:hypothetical protein
VMPVAMQSAAMDALFVHTRAAKLAFGYSE